MARKFYLPNQDLVVGQTVTISGDEFLHITKVLRNSIGDFVPVFNGSGKDYTAQIKSISKNSLDALITSENTVCTETKNFVCVFQALVKADKFEIITQKLTELGVKKIVPFYSSFCQVKPNTTRLDRLEKISIEALKQCGRSKKVEITPVQTFDQMIESLAEFDKVIFAYEKSNQNFAENFLDNNDTNSQKVAIIIGSEGGFSPDENQKIAQLPNAKSVSLGSRILRAETASIALTSVVMFLLGEWNKNEN